MHIEMKRLKTTESENKPPKPTKILTMTIRNETETITLTNLCTSIDHKSLKLTNRPKLTTSR